MNLLHFTHTHIHSPIIIQFPSGIPILHIVCHQNHRKCRGNNLQFTLSQVIRTFCYQFRCCLSSFPIQWQFIHRKLHRLVAMHWDTEYKIQIFNRCLCQQAYENMMDILNAARNVFWLWNSTILCLFKNYMCVRHHLDSKFYKLWSCWSHIETGCSRWQTLQMFENELNEVNCKWACNWMNMNIKCVGCSIDSFVVVSFLWIINL